MTQAKQTPTERSITNSIMRFLATVPSCYARKIHGSRYTAGLPDIICVYRGMALMIEVKRPGCKPTKLQEVELGKWSGAGAWTIIAYSKEDVQAALDFLDMKNPPVAS